MSAPDTNPERQSEKHRHALLGIRGAMLFGVLMIVLMIAFTVTRGTEPSEETLIGDEGAEGSENAGAGGVKLDEYAPGTNESN